jgi:hypothetical protein
VEAQAALTLADSDADRKAAEDLLASIAKAAAKSNQDR